MDTIGGMLRQLRDGYKLERNTSCYKGQEERHVSYSTVLGMSYGNPRKKDVPRAGSAVIQHVFRDVI